MAQVEREMMRYKIKIFGLSEMRWPDSDDICTSVGNSLIYSGTSRGGESDVGILTQKSLKKSLMSWKAVSHRIVTARFHTRVKNVLIVQCYVLTETTSDEMKEEFYSLLITSLICLVQT